MQGLLQGITQPVEANKLAQGVGLGYEEGNKRRRLGNGPPGFEVPDSIPLPPPSSPFRCTDSLKSLAFGVHLNEMSYYPF